VTRETEPVDVLVVGSGASAVHAAWPLVEAGLRVRMLDFGNRPEAGDPLVPPLPFSELRRSDPQQHRYFLGDRFEGIGFGLTGASAQLTPPRQYVCRDAAELTPVSSRSFFPLESLARGGLASAWGAGCPAFSPADLEGIPLRHGDLAPHYEAVAGLIGVSGSHDDLAPFFGELAALEPPLELDSNAESILALYGRRRERLHRGGLYLGRPRLAVLSRAFRGRDGQRYRDMDFWSDEGRSVWRPCWTLEELERSPAFDYVPGQLVERFAEQAPSGPVSVIARDRSSNDLVRHAGRRLILAAGALGSTRIVLRSLGLYDRPVPLVCNAHVYAAMVNLGLLGRPARDARHSLAQLAVVHATEGPGGPATVGHLYSYRSLLLFRLLRDSALPVREGLQVARLLLSCLTVLIIQHADAPGPGKRCTLRAGLGGNDWLEIDYAPTRAERVRQERIESSMLARLRALRLWCLRRVRPGHAASIHYAGTLPMTSDARELTTDLHGRLRGTRSVHLADGSVFGRLPSRGLTFTMMAAARRVGCLVRDELRA
jgi:choline dehydrogenase-like flavoprotein